MTFDLTRDDLLLLANHGDPDEVVLALQVLFPDLECNYWQGNPTTPEEDLRNLLAADRYELATVFGCHYSCTTATLESWQPSAVQIALLAQPNWLWVWQQDLANLEPPEKPIGFFEVRVIPAPATTPACSPPS